MKSFEKVLQSINFIQMAPFGSRVVGCAKDTSDYDYLVLVPRRPTTSDMRHTDFVPDSENPLYGKYFSSWRSGNINLVFTTSKAYYDATLEACDFCKKYKVYDKVDRCKIHEKFKDAVINSVITDFLILP